MPVKSLVDLASAACIKHIRHLDSVGDYLPYENVRHILFKVDNAVQLRRIELNSPQLEGQTGEIWLRIIERDFPLEYRARAYKPQSPSKWYRVWEKYKKDHDIAIEESAMKLKSAFAGLRQDKEKNTSKIVEGRLLPTKGRIKSKSRRAIQSDRSSLTFTSGSKTKTLNGAGVMRKVRREVKEIASIHGSLSRPVETVNYSRGLARVQVAPKSMVNEHRRATLPTGAPSRKQYTPKVSSAVTEHEAKATFISDSEEEPEDSYGDEDDEELFDESDKEAPPPPPRSSTKHISTAPPRPPISSSTRAHIREEEPIRAPVKARPVALPKTEGPRPTGLSGRMAQKFGQPRVIKKPTPSTAAASKPASTASSVSTSTHKPTARSSPPSSPPPASEAKPLPPALARKRKAVGVFMRPKKRAT